MVKRKGSSAGGRYAKRSRLSSKRKSFGNKVARLKSNAFTRKIKRVMFKMAEPKHFLTNVAKQELFHNGGTSAVFVSHVLNAIGPAQGMTESARIGDRYYRSGWKINMLIGQKFDRPNVTWRIAVIKAAYNLTSVGFSNILEQGASGNVLLDNINKDKYTVLYQKYIHKNWSPTVPVGAVYDVAGNGTSTSGGKELTWAHKFWVPCRKEVKFLTDAGVTPNEDSFILLIAAYDAFGSLLTDNIGYVQTHVKEFYRDP